MSTTDSPGAALRHLHPFEEQEPFLRDDKKYYGYISGVGAGKTFAGILRTALNVHRWNPGEMGAIVAPTTTMIKDVIIPEMRDLGFMDHWTYKSAHTDEPGIHTPNDSRILLLSADNRRTIERLRGLNLAWWWIDEAAQVDERARDILTQRLRSGEYRNGFVTTTPQGHNHTYEFFVGDIDGEYRDHGEAEVYEADDRLSILRVPTHANPYTPEDYKEQMDEDHDGRFYEQEVLGRFVQYEGLIYPWFSDDHVVPRDSLPEHYDQVIYGCDWGHNNPAVTLAVARHDDTWMVVDEWYERRCTAQDHARAAHALVSEWGEGPVYCDPSEPANIETLQREGLDARAADNDVLPGIQHVSSLQDRLRVVEDAQNTRNELNQYQYRDGGDSDKPLKQNDHAMDALRYALYSESQRSEPSTGVAFA